jgi:flagellar basal body rod protein FlgC
MTVISENRLNFEFPESFDVIKYDESQFFQSHFKKISNGIKAVDIIAVSESTTYLIEVKDYTHPDTKSEGVNLVNIVIEKVLSTLSALMPMKNNAHLDNEKNLARKALITTKIVIVLHVEIPPRTKKIKQSFINLSNLQMELKKKIKPIDPHPKVVSMNKMGHLPWKVNSLRN